MPPGAADDEDEDEEEPRTVLVTGGPAPPPLTGDTTSEQQQQLLLAPSVLRPLDYDIHLHLGPHFTTDGVVDIRLETGQAPGGLQSFFLHSSGLRIHAAILGTWPVLATQVGVQWCRVVCGVAWHCDGG